MACYGVTFQSHTLYIGFFLLMITIKLSYGDAKNGKIEQELWMWKPISKFVTGSNAWIHKNEHISRENKQMQKIQTNF